MSLTPREINFDEVWGGLRETVRCVINMEPIRRAVWNDRFSDVYALCVAYPEPLADQLYNETRKYLIQHVFGLYEVVSHAENLLRDYQHYWGHYSTGVGYLHRLYLYLNQQHIKKQRVTDAEELYGNANQNKVEQMEIGELGLEVWKDFMIKPLGPRLVKYLIDEINCQRSQKPMNNTEKIVQGCILSFVDVQNYKKKGNMELYEDMFEEPYLSNCVEYYRGLTTQYLNEFDVSIYVNKVLQKFSEEKRLAEMFLHKSSEPKVEQKCNYHLVIDNLEFLKRESVPLITAERWQDVSSMYTLLKSVPDGLKVILDAFSEVIKAEGLNLVIQCFNDSNYREFIESVLKVHSKYVNLVQALFCNDQRFISSLDKACSIIINYKPTAENRTICRSSELLAKYCDWLLKKSSKDFSESEIDDRLSNCITVFKYIEDKDVFQKFYSRMLAKRLIHQQSQSMDSEENMINRLKQACGYEFTNKLHRMFTDMSLSQDLNDKFNQSLKTDNCELNVSFYINVLQAGAWPLSQPSNGWSFVLPTQLEKSVQMFEKFYNNQFSGRKLTWLHYLCQVEMKFNYLKKPYIVTVQTLQMAILLRFENQDSLTLKDLQEHLQASDDNFLKNLQSLLDAKLIIAKDPELGMTSETESTEIEMSGATSNVEAVAGAVSETVRYDPKSVFFLNKSFSNKRTKFRITAAIQKETPQEVEHTVTSVEEDRKLFIQAAVVRIMKARKIMKHNALIQEILHQSQGAFIPNVSMIKKCIEALIEKQYIERTANSGDEYSYVA